MQEARARGSSDRTRGSVRSAADTACPGRLGLAAPWPRRGGRERADALGAPAAQPVRERGAARGRGAGDGEAPGADVTRCPQEKVDDSTGFHGLERISSDSERRSFFQVLKMQCGW